MPNLDFYAVADDWLAVLEAVFGLGLFRVLESDSAPDRELREFQTAAEVLESPRGRSLALFVVEAGPEPMAKRIEFLPGVAGDATFRYTCEGWGLVQLYYYGPLGTRQLRWSHTNHNTQKRAAAWARTTSRLGDPAAWNWPAVTSASNKLNRIIRRMAVSKIGSHPVLPHAAEFIAQAGLRYEYGTGIHVTPSYGMVNR
ncbi:hypothetical protein [Micromonospora sp. NBC_01796]|uniref:hypothetical protein n=1 Tax=Micromonospora sp. NBC_01796 TaxID=2975987 RepID=UPI002DDB6210|nr:hypothetical protein [Micromonospora sp. NBC_01796]WSA83981.1 hypothetical protein OIE47_26955 [Micromonospora sp. NBC_01796]